jgi:hypothetical protein
VQKRLCMIGLGMLVLAMTGCESTRWNWLKPGGGGDLAGKPTAPANVELLVKYLNNNADRVRTVRIDDMSIDASMGSQSVALQGRIYAEKPRNFRMKATLLGKDEVDIGSNSDEFWFWAQRNPDPFQYFCSYKDLSAGRCRTMPLPIQPEWVMETLGLGPFGPAEKYKLEPDGQNLLRLVEKATSPQGTPVRKVIVINRKEKRPPEPQVVAFLLLDDRNGQEICSAHILTTKLDRTTNAVLPHKMELRVPAQKMTMSLKLDGLTANSSIVATAFQRQPLAGVEQFNLATSRTEPWGMQRTQGFEK